MGTYGHLLLPYPIAVADKNGNHGVSFTQLSEPSVLPEIIYDRKISLHEMGSPGLGKRGNRVIETYQTDVNWSDVEFMADMITPEQLIRLRNFSNGVNDATDPGYVIYTPGGSSMLVYYLGVIAQDPKPGNYRFNGRLFHKVQIRIHILKVSQTTINYGATLPIVGSPF